MIKNNQMKNHPKQRTVNSLMCLLVLCIYTVVMRVVQRHDTRNVGACKFLFCKGDCRAGHAKRHELVAGGGTMHTGRKGG